MDTETIAREVADEEGTPSAPDAPDQGPERTEATSQDSSRMFEFSTYIHVGPGADTCPNRENGTCTENLHFHAWARMPNPFQQNTIREKANAAKARRMRLLRDPESDARTIIDASVDEMIHHGDKEAMIELIVAKDFLEDQLKAMREVQGDEELGFTHIDDDRERLRALDRLPVEDRPEEEYDELTKHVDSYHAKVEEVRGMIQQPVRSTLAEKDIESVGEILRNDLMEQDSQQAWNDTYDRWEWLTCTLKPRDPDKGLPNTRVWADVEQMESAAPEIIEAIKPAYAELESDAGRRAKNSS